MLHRLCGPPSIPLSFSLATVLPRRYTYCVNFGTNRKPAHTKCTSFTARTTGLSNPVCSPSFRASASVSVQKIAFATGVPPDLYTFHRYTGNSIFLSGTQEKQSRAQFLGWAEGFHTRLPSPPTRPLRPVIPSNACRLRITAAAGTELAVASSEGTVKCRRYSRRHPSFPLTGVYDPKAFVPHAAALRQAFAHCGKFPTAASRRSRDRVSVPVWLVVLSDQLPVIALVSRSLTN